MLERSGFEVIAYDARGHGESDPCPTPEGYTYPELADDLRQVLDMADIDRAILAGVSMGAATTMRFALDNPDRVSALVQITPAQLDPTPQVHLDRWNALADGLETGGVDGFMAAYGDPPIEERFRGLVKKAIRQRMERHLHPQAVADALRVVPGSQAFDGPDALKQLQVPTLVVGSRDQLDPEHPLEVAVRYADLLPNSEFVVEDEGKSPLAWRGGQLSKTIVDFAARQGLVPVPTSS
jgi:pimeloyl-ACP methyl ester carboxylesterase